jgi:predicted aspartyl protease
MKMSAARLIAVLIQATALLLAETASSGQDDVYRWTDERGVIHFSDSGAAPAHARRVEGQRSRTAAVSGTRPTRAARDIPLVSVDGKRLVRATLEGPYRTADVQMIVDTGAQMTMIDEGTANQVGVEFVEEAGIVGVTGVAPGWLGRIRRIRLEDREVDNWPVMVGPLPGVLLLGMDVIDHLELSVGPESLYRR